ncbi:MAG: response regulator [Bryobacteraceae bacterium]|nr:response regulator [Solibacteraceae bacterium]MCL4842366.1 response regulator [Bryobacteraceae bacterium]MCO5351990.1 response regulator [Bryobacteraceae bacterium]
MADRKAQQATSTRILLVDDNRAGLAARRAVLEELGYNTTGAECPKRALELFHAAREGAEAFDLLVTDFKMPAMTGLELIRQVRASVPTLPVILISGFVDALGLTEASTGANVVIMKSANEVQHLVRAAKRLLGGALRKPPRRTNSTPGSAAAAARRRTGSTG